MRTTQWLMTVILGLLLAGCAATSNAPTPEARQALAPTGKLRVALQLGSPHNVVRASSLAGTVEALKSGRADAIFSIKPSLFEVSSQYAL
jgi:hypothetical protein